MINITFNTFYNNAYCFSKCIHFKSWSYSLFFQSLFSFKIITKKLIFGWTDLHKITLCFQKVNNNGDVTFRAPLTQYTSQPFPINGSHKIIAPFWTDIDTTNGGQLWYRPTTQNSVLQQGTSKIRSLFPNILNFVASWMMVVTWENVAAYHCGPTKNITCSQVHA